MTVSNVNGLVSKQSKKFFVDVEIIPLGFQRLVFLTQVVQFESFAVFDLTNQAKNYLFLSRIFHFKFYEARKSCLRSQNGMIVLILLAATVVARLVHYFEAAPLTQ